MTLFINILNHTRYSEKYIHRLMKETKIQARIRRKKCNYLKSNPETEAQNILHREFKAQWKNQKWFINLYKSMAKQKESTPRDALLYYIRSILTLICSYQDKEV